MEVFIRKIREAYPLSDETVRLLLGHTERVVLPKGELLMREGTVAKYTYFVIKGFARGFFHKEDKDITIWFASEGMSLLSMNGYMFSTAGYENVELLEECDLLKISNGLSHQGSPECLNREHLVGVEMVSTQATVPQAGVHHSCAYFPISSTCL